MYPVLGISLIMTSLPLLMGVPKATWTLSANIVAVPFCVSLLSNIFAVEQPVPLPLVSTFQPEAGLYELIVVLSAAFVAIEFYDVSSRNVIGVYRFVA